MTLSETLKQATNDAHRSAESREMQRQLVRGLLEEERLIAYLAQLGRIHADLERRFDAAPDIARVIGFSDAHRHGARLERDLAALGAGGETEPSAATGRLLTAIDTAVAREPAALLGFFYVLEGSMNGNRFIARALRETPAADRCSFSYFEPHGEAQPARWAAFRNALDAAGLEPEQEQAVVDAALHQFAAIAEISDEVMASGHPASAG